MQSGEIKTCPQCHNDFTCNSHDIVNCHCYDILLSEQATVRIRASFDDCLCAFCLGKHTFSSPQTGTIVEESND